MNIQISTNTIVLLAVLAMLGTLVPMILAFRYVNRYKVKISTFFLGVLTYITFAMIVIQFPVIALQEGIPGFKEYLLNHPVVASLYLASLTALVEEAGRYFMFSFTMKKRMNKREALMLGVGHGGTCSMLTGTSVMMSNAILAFAIHSMGAGDYLARLGLSGEPQEEAKQSMIEFGKISNFEHFFDGSTPILILIAEIAFSYLMFLGIMNASKKIMFPTIFILHFILLTPVYFVRKEVTGNVVFAELIMILVLMCIVSLAYQLYKKDDDTYKTTE